MNIFYVVYFAFSVIFSCILLFILNTIIYVVLDPLFMLLEDISETRARYSGRKFIGTINMCW